MLAPSRLDSSGGEGAESPADHRAVQWRHSPRRYSMIAIRAADAKTAGGSDLVQDSVGVQLCWNGNRKLPDARVR